MNHRLHVLILREDMLKPVPGGEAFFHQFAANNPFHFLDLRRIGKRTHHPNTLRTTKYWHPAGNDGRVVQIHNFPNFGGFCQQYLINPRIFNNRIYRFANYLRGHQAKYVLGGFIEDLDLVIFIGDDDPFRNR